MTVQRLDQLFVDLKKELIPLISSISKKPAPNDKFLNEGKYDVAKQAQFCKDISKQIGFDFDGGRMDTSEHPFCTNFDVKDVRITTKYSENEFVQGIFAAVHETGHALYEQGLNKKHVGLPVSFALSMGMHESQSLFWERMIALSDPFWKFYYPKLQETFPQLKSLSLKDYLRAVNKVEPSLIRIEADELTYVMHIIIRYEIEKGLFDGTIKVADMSKIFNRKMKDYVGIDVPSDSKGVLQDVHWYEGLFGYFPTYTLGAIYASQLYKQAANDIPDIEKAIEIGNFGPIKSWLNSKVHEKGSLYTSADELMKTVTNGTGLDSKVFVDYLKTKYSKLYEL
jgi:carboxypeptidase Taq